MASSKGTCADPCSFNRTALGKLFRWRLHSRTPRIPCKRNADRRHFFYVVLARLACKSPPPPRLRRSGARQSPIKSTALRGAPTEVALAATIVAYLLGAFALRGVGYPDEAAMLLRFPVALIAFMTTILAYTVLWLYVAPRIRKSYIAATEGHEKKNREDRCASQCGAGRSRCRVTVVALPPRMGRRAVVRAATDARTPSGRWLPHLANGVCRGSEEILSLRGEARPPASTARRAAQRPTHRGAGSA